MDEGTTTTPFDMTVLNRLDRFQLVLDAIRSLCAVRPPHGRRPRTIGPSWSGTNFTSANTARTCRKSRELALDALNSLDRLLTAIAVRRLPALALVDWKTRGLILVRGTLDPLLSTQVRRVANSRSTRPNRIARFHPAPTGRSTALERKPECTPRIEVADAQGRRLTSEPVAGNDHKSAMAAIHRWFAAHAGSEAALAGVGHRVVHGELSRPRF